MKHPFLLILTSVVLVAGLLDGEQHQNLFSFYNKIGMLPRSVRTTVSFVYR